MRLKTGLLVSLSAASLSLATNVQEYHLDINDLDAIILAGETTIVEPVQPGVQVDYTGTIAFRNSNVTEVLEAEFEGGQRELTPPNPGGIWFDLTVDLLNGNLQSGSLTVTDGQNTYTADVSSESGLGVGVLFTSALGGIKLVGITFDGSFADTSADATFFTIDGISVFDFGNGNLPGTFDELDMNGVAGATLGVPFDNDVTIDLFVESLKDENGGGCPDGSAECVWDNGDGTGLDGQSSEIGTATEESYAADDFTLKEGFVYEINDITVDMIVDSESTEAELLVLYDCDGNPGEEVPCGDLKSTDFEVLQDLPGGAQLIRFTFDAGRRSHVDEYGNIEEKEALWLHGGTYWITAVGIGDGTFYDSFFWSVASQGDAVGSVPQAQNGPLKVEEWTPISTINLQCANLAFEVNACPCCVICDNGKPDFSSSGFAAEFDTTVVNSRNADNFVTGTECEDFELCFVKAWVLTNCDPTRAKLDLYADDCDEVGELQNGNRTVDKVIQLSSDDSPLMVDIDGRAVELHAYELQWHNLEWFLSSGDNYWLSAYVQGTGSLSEYAFWTFNQDCASDCDIKLSEGRWTGIRTPSFVRVSDIIDGERDFAFKIAGRTESQSSNDDLFASSCEADYNGDGLNNIADMLDFLDVWFDGCE